MRSQMIARGFAVVLFSSILAACGGGGASIGSGGGGSSNGGSSGASSGSSSSGSGTSSSSGTTAFTCASLNLLSSTAQLPSSASQQANGVTVTALCRDSHNNVVQGANVGFTASAGAINVTQGTTDGSGVATAVLTTFGDATNQSITVTASNSGASKSLTIAETGTTVRVSGPTVIGSGAQVSYTVTLADSSSKGIPNQTVSLTSSSKNPITPVSQNTDTNGQAIFTYTGTTGGSDSLSAQATALNASSAYAVTVSSTSLTFTQPTGNSPTVLIGTPTTVQVKYVQNGSPVAGATVNFSSTRGTLSSSTGTTDASGLASVVLNSTGSDGAGGVIVTAAVAGSGPSASFALVLVATKASSITIQATPSTIAPSATSTVTAVVRDASNNLVAGQTVNFALSDPTGGSLSAASGVTDQSGSVSVTYKATSVSSAQNGVQISATVNGTTVTTPSPAQITVGGQALRITLGTGNKVIVLDETRYQYPYSVVVTDAAGNPAANATFNLQLVSTAYQKGHYIFVTADNLWEIDGNSLVPSTSLDFNSNDKFPFGCKSEDVNNNGILDPGEDYNKNGVLDPGAVASVPSSIALDSTGSAQFLITYPKDRANWVEVRLTGTATVAGTESTATAEFVLPVASTDISSRSVSPPGAVSPYGDIANLNQAPGTTASPNTCEAKN